MDVKTGIREEDGKTEVTVTLTPEETKPYIDAYFKRLGRTRIPGFRPGKAPRKVLERNFGGHAAIYAEIASEVVNGSAPAAVDGQGVIFITDPVFDDANPLADGEPFTFTVYGKVKPEVELLSYDPVKITMPPLQATDAEVDAQVDVLRRYYDPSGNGALSDEEFCDKAGVESVDDLRRQVAEAIGKQRVAQEDDLKERRCIEALGERVHGEVPQAYINYTRDDILRDFYKSLQRSGQTFDSFLAAQGATREQFDADVLAQATEIAAQSLALDALFAEKGFSVEEADIDAEFDAVPDSAAAKEQWAERGQIGVLREAIARRKATKWLVETAEVAVEEIVPAADDAVAGGEAKEKKPAAKKPAAKKSTAKKTGADKTAAKKPDGGKAAE